MKRQLNIFKNKKAKIESEFDLDQVLNQHNIENLIQSEFYPLFEIFVIVGFTIINIAFMFIN